jgi:tRNA A37 threonylcarbamoyladenosine synthetase subunit TsaC/SUA5/YrdC
VYKILALKKRDVAKGMILIASDFSQVASYVNFDALNKSAQDKILGTWPGPVTWLLPKSDNTPDWLSGDSDMLAVRISSHPLVIKMCDYLGKPMVSTSANPAGEAPAMNTEELMHYFGNNVKIMRGELGSQTSPSKIFHSLTMETIRA